MKFVLTQSARSWISVLLVFGVCGVQAQALRDPTQPPLSALATPTSAQAPGLTPEAGMAVLVRDGVPYLMSGTRLYAKGQSLGAARIEKITETQVWLREAGVLRKVSVFAGIERHASVPLGAASSRSKSPRVVPPPKP